MTSRTAGVTSSWDRMIMVVFLSGVLAA